MDQVPSHARQSIQSNVKNKAPASVQITAEQLLREAWDHKEALPKPVPRQQIVDAEELADYQRHERQQFEMRIVRNRSHTPLWLRYARWEESQSEFKRARSIYERAIDNDYREPTVWLAYAEMEMRHRFVNHARNVLDRAVSYLPRVDSLWLKYAHMEEMLKRDDLVRVIYNRWLEWIPNESAYFSFIRFELRCSQIVNVRTVYEKLVKAHPKVNHYIKYAYFEEGEAQLARARGVFERASKELPVQSLNVRFFVDFAKFELRQNQIDRVRAIFNYATNIVTIKEKDELNREYFNFERQHGNNEQIEGALIKKKITQLQNTTESEPTNYEAWFDLLQLHERLSAENDIREAYEKAIACKPKALTKPGWSRYLYVWLAYAAWTELSCKDSSTTIEVYKRCVSSIPNQHKTFSFGKLWRMYAHAEIRQGNLESARRILGTGLGLLPKKKSLYLAYVDLETSLGEFDRARKIFGLWVQRDARNSQPFLSFADFELKFGELTRARKILEIATTINDLKDQLRVWDKIAELIGIENIEKASDICEQYIAENNSLYQWRTYLNVLSTAQVESDQIRKVCERAYKALKEKAMKLDAISGSIEREDAMTIGQIWLSWEKSQASDDLEKQKERIEHVKRVLPRRKSNNNQATENERISEEVTSNLPSRLVFPEEEATSTAQDKILALSKLWKSQQLEATS